jgi:hypothetical protein
MPGLSDYQDQYVIDAPANDLDQFIDETGEPGLAARMRQRYLDSLGFADLTRSAPDEIMHGMMQNIPRSEWDKPAYVDTPGEPQEIAEGWWIQQSERSPEYTFRQLMEALGKMRPNEGQRP